MKPGPDLDARIRDLLRELLEAPLDSRDARYVDLDEGGLGIRQPEYAPRADLRDGIELAETPTCQLFSGFRGTGKSTELNRLRADLEAAGYTVLHADAAQYLSLQRELTVHELLFAIAGAFGSAAGELLSDDQLAKSPWKRLVTFLSREVKFDLAVDLPGVALRGALRGDDAFLDRLRATMAGRVDALAAEVHDFVAECIGKLDRRTPQHRGVVFLLDSLEKLSGPASRFVERMEGAVHTFATAAHLLRLPLCHTIYAVPLYFERLYPGLPDDFDGPLRVLPTVKVFERPGRSPFQRGVEGLRGLVEARIGTVEDVLPLEDLDRLIQASGGHIRALLHLVRQVVKSSRRTGLPAPPTNVTRVLNEFSEDQRNAVRADAAPMLDSVRRTFSIDQVETADLPLLAHYLDSRLVLCYRNGEGWYDVHPTIREHVARLARRDEPDGDD